MNREEYVESAKMAFISLAKKAVMAGLARELPNLFAGKIGMIFNPFIGLFVSRILKIAINEGETGVFFYYIDMRVGDQSKEFEAAAEYNYLIQKTGTKDEKLKAEARLKAAFDKFAKLSS